MQKATAKEGHRAFQGGEMADAYDRFDNEGGRASSFVLGLLTGTVLGAGLGMLFAPKAGSELRRQLSDQAGNLANQASEGYRRATGSAGEWADQGKEAGKEIYNKVREAFSRGGDEAQRHVRDAATGMAGMAGASPSTSSGSSGTDRGSSSGSEAGHGSAGSDMPGSSSEESRGSGS
jgi:gas vesicle protein